MARKPYKPSHEDLKAFDDFINQRMTLPDCAKHMGLSTTQAVQARFATIARLRHRGLVSLPSQVQQLKDDLDRDHKDIAGLEQQHDTIQAEARGWRTGAIALALILLWIALAAAFGA